MSEIIPCGAYYLYKDDKSPFWQVRAEAAPRLPLWKSTREINQTLAMKKAKNLYSQWVMEKDANADEKMFRHLHAEYLESQASFLKPSTLLRLRGVGEKHLIPFFGNMFLNEIAAAWPRFVRQAKKKRPNSTLFNERKFLLSELKYAFNVGWIDRIPNIAVVPGKRSEFHVFKDEELKRLIDNAPNSECRLHILLGYLMGLRHGEIAQLKIQDFDLKTKTLHVRGTKTWKSNRLIALNEAVIDPVKLQIEAVSGKSKFLFPQVHNPAKHKDQRVIDKDWQNLKRKLGIKGRFHDLRHTCATKLAESSVPSEVACAYLGMSLRIYDATYCHLGLAETKKAATIVRLPEAVDFAVENLADG